MRTTTKRWTLAVAVLLAATACTHDGLDDGDGLDSALEIDALQNNPVSAQLQGQQGNQTCTLEVQDWVGTATNAPLSGLGGEGSPFNDITLDAVDITYEWIDGVTATPARSVGLGGITIPIGDSANFTFAPIAFQDLTLAATGQTANLTLVFRGHTVENEPVTETVSRQLFVEVCPAAP